MGLSIIHGIISDCGGTITVESELGKGSTFHVYFPVVEKEALPEIEEPENIPMGKERILFVDDEELLAEMGKDMLERLGYHVTVRRSSLEALESFQNTPGKFDLVITDQTMPDMTGSDLSRRMMQIRPDIPIILCTGYSNLIDEDSAKTLGIKEFALKPLTKSVIAKLIRKVLNGAESKVNRSIEKKSFDKQVVQTHETIKSGTEQILLVDDEKAILTMEKIMLERLGYQVTSRAGSIEALEAFKDSPDTFDLVITDLAMSDMSGDKLAAELIKIRPDIPVLLCTGFSEPMSEEKAISSGIKGFLLKPVVMKDLFQKIREVLDEKHTAQPH